MTWRQGAAMDRLELATHRAEEAARVLNSPLFDAAFTDTRTALLEALAGMDNVRDERAQDLHRMVRVLEKVKRCMEVHIDTGKLAQKEIEGRRRLFDFKRPA